MRKPKILLPPRRRRRVPRTEVGAHPVAFAALTPQGECLAETTVPRNVLHQWMHAAKQMDLGTLAWIGLHGVTHLDSAQARHLARDLAMLRQTDKRIPSSLIETAQRVSSRTDLELVIAAGL